MKELLIEHKKLHSDGNRFIHLSECVIKNQQDALFLLNLFQWFTPLHVSNRLTIYYQEAVTVYAAYGIYHASVLTSC